LFDRHERLGDDRFELLPWNGLEHGPFGGIEFQPDGFGRVGTPGLLTEKGFSALIWRGENAFFVGKGPHDRDYRRGTTLKFDKSTEAKYIELQIKDSTGKLQPEFSVKVWQ